MITFYLVRHGEAQNNIRHIANSMPETEHFPLTEAGRKKVAETAEHLKSIGAVAILSSPVERTKESADIIATATGLPVELDDRLREVDMGLFNNALLTDFHEAYPNPRLRLHTNGVDGVEGSDEMRERVVDFANEMKRRFAGKTIIVVSHADTLEQLHGFLTGASIEEAALGWSPERGSWKKVEWKG